MEEWSFGMTGEWSTLPGGKHECSYAIRTLHFASPGSMAPLGSTGTAHLRKMQSRVRRPHVGQDAIPASIPLRQRPAFPLRQRRLEFFAFPQQGSFKKRSE